MSTIGERVRYAIDHMGKGEFYAALEHACNALDVTSQRYYNQKSSGRSHFKKIIKEYHWLVEFMSLGGINLDETRFENFSIETTNKTILSPDFSDLMYHVVRCGLVHSDTLATGFSFHDKPILEFADQKITFPTNVIWAILAVVIFCPSNKNELTAQNYWIGFYENRLVINDFWGCENIAKHIVEKYPMPRVVLKNLRNLQKNELIQ